MVARGMLCSSTESVVYVAMVSGAPTHYCSVVRVCGGDGVRLVTLKLKGQIEMVNEYQHLCAVQLIPFR